MATYYMLFNEGGNKTTDTQWFVSHFVGSDFREKDLQWIAEQQTEFEDVGIAGVYSEDGEPFTFLSKYRQHIPDDWIKVIPNNIIGEI